MRSREVTSRRTLSRRPAWAWVGVAVSVLAAWQAPARCAPADEEGSPATAAPSAADPRVLAERFVRLSCARARLQAAGPRMEEEATALGPSGRLSASATEVGKVLAATETDVAGGLARMLDASAASVGARAGAALDVLRDRARGAKQAWIEVRTAVAQRRLVLPDAARAHRRAAAPGSLLSLDDGLFWLSALLALVVLAGTIAYDRRHALRRLLAGWRSSSPAGARWGAAAMGVAAVAVPIGCLLGARALATSSAPPPGEETAWSSILAENQALEEEVAALREACEPLQQQHEAAVAEWTARGKDRLGPASDLATHAAQLRRAALQSHETLAVVESLPEAIEEDCAALASLEEEIGGHVQAAVASRRLRSGLRGAMGLLLLGFAVTVARAHRKAMARRRRETAATCPLCLGRGRLVRLSEPAGGRGPRLVRCRNVVSRQPYEECDYTFLGTYRPMAKLCFPTLGVPQAGKTHWLAMLYWELGRGAYPAPLHFENVRSETTDEFDAIVEGILRSRIGTAATQRGRIPRPLVFHFRDRDRLGRSEGLVNVFDYSGEVTSDMGAEDFRRQRALRAEGYLFFLDPTYPHEPQARALAAFREDLRAIHGLGASGRLAVPVALCIPKIDLLVGQGYALADGSDAVTEFYRGLAAIDPTGQSRAERVIAARSRLTLGLYRVIWPGWEIERQMRDLFGRRYAFFPLTPVGLDGRGQRDLSLRTIEPFGLIEPLLWLIEMNGYRVLDP